MDQFYTISLFVLGLVLCYFTYQVVNLVYTNIKQRRKEGTMEYCFSDMGKIAYIAMIVGYVLAWALFIWTVVMGVKIESLQWMNNGLAVLTVYTILFSMQLANMVVLGKKHMLVGRFLVDYRKMKKIDLNSHNEMSFVYAQKNYHFSTRFVDVRKLREAIARRS